MQREKDNNEEMCSERKNQKEILGFMIEWFLKQKQVWGDVRQALCELNF